MLLAGKRRKFSGEDKVRILKRHLVDKIPVSDVCDEQGLHPTMFYKWQKEFFENGAAAFERRADAKSRWLEKENAALKTKMSVSEGRGDRRDHGVSCGSKKKSWGKLKGCWVGSSPISVMRWWIMCVIGLIVHPFQRHFWWAGSVSAGANSTSGECDMVRQTSITPGFPAIFGWSHGSVMRSRPTSKITRLKVIGD